MHKRFGNNIFDQYYERDHVLHRYTSQNNFRQSQDKAGGRRQNYDDRPNVFNVLQYHDVFIPCMSDYCSEKY